MLLVERGTTAGALVQEKTIADAGRPDACPPLCV